jgi:hemerythrin-like metal-binding protein
MAKKIFDFDLEFKLGIDAVDNEHMKLVDMLNDVHSLISEGKKDEARIYFGQTLSNYVNEHFTNEENFMKGMGYPAFDEHKKIHENFKKSFQELAPTIETFDEAAFRQALSDTFTWIITHIGKTDKKYVTFFVSKR